MDNTVKVCRFVTTQPNFRRDWGSWRTARAEAISVPIALLSGETVSETPYQQERALTISISDLWALVMARTTWVRREGQTLIMPPTQVLPKIFRQFERSCKDFERSCQRFSSNLRRTVHFIIFVSVESLLLLGQRPVFATDNQVSITNHQSPGTTTNHHPKPFFCYYPSAPLNF